MPFKLAQILDQRRHARLLARMGGGTAGVRVIRPGVGDVTRLLAMQAQSAALGDLPADHRTPSTVQ